MKNAVRTIFALIIVAVILTGCWDQKVYERLGFILNMGLDIDGTEKLHVTYSMPVISESGGSSGGGGQSSGDEIKSEVLPLNANLLREARDEGRMLSPKQLEGGKIQNILLSREFAQKNAISSYFEIFERDVMNSVQAWVVVVDGSAEELMTTGAKFKGKPRLAMYLNDLLTRNAISGYCPDENIIKYDIDNSLPGISPIVPVIKLEKEDIKVTGTALIDRDKMTGQLDTRETACMFLAMGKKKKSEILFNLPAEIHSDKKYGIIFPRKLKTKQKIQFVNNIPEISFDIKIGFIMDEYTWGYLTDDEYKRKLEESIDYDIKSCLEKAFKKLQTAKCDPMGIGNKVRAYHNSYWESIGGLDGWKKIYPQIKAVFNVKSNIIRYGAIE